MILFHPQKKLYRTPKVDGCTFDGLKDFLCTPRQRDGSKARTGWLILTMEPDPVGLSLLQDHIQDWAMTLHSH